MSFSTDYSGRKYCSTPKYGTNLPMLLAPGSTILNLSLKKRNSEKRLVKRTENKFEEHNLVANVSENVILLNSESECDQQKPYLVDISGDEHSSPQKNSDNVAENKCISQKFEFDNESTVERLSLEVEDLGIFENAKASLFVDDDSKENDIGLFRLLMETSDNFYDNIHHERTPEPVRDRTNEISKNNSLSAIKTARTTWHSHAGKGESSDHRIKNYTKAYGINRSKAKSHVVTFLISDDESSLSSDEDCVRLKYIEPDPSFKSLSVVADMLWDEFVDDEPLIDKYRAVQEIKKGASDQMNKKQATIAKNRKRMENNEKKHVVHERNCSIAGSSKEVDIEEIIFPRREKHSQRKHCAPKTQMKQDFVTTATDPYDVGDIEEIVFPRREKHSQKKHCAPKTQMKQDVVTTSTDPYDVGDIEEIVFPRREKHSQKKHFAPKTQMKQDFVATAIDPYDVGDNMKQVSKVLKCSPRKKPKIVSSRILSTKYRLVTK